jgi:hypothetical protein
MGVRAYVHALVVVGGTATWEKRMGKMGLLLTLLGKGRTCLSVVSSPNQAGSYKYINLVVTVITTGNIARFFITTYIIASIYFRTPHQAVLESSRASHPPCT